MAGVYEHLKIEKEPLINERRKIRRNPPTIKRDDPQAHGRRIRKALSGAVQKARLQPGSEDGNYVLKLHYSGSLDFKNLTKHGVEFLSQEDNTVCIVFATEKGLTEFSEHLLRLGASEDDELTYRQILLALDGVGNWTREDRESWAIKRYGLPSVKTFKLDVELWPMGPGNSPERKRMVQGFERWLNQEAIRMIDRISRDSLVMYRLEASREQTGLSLEHRDVRLVDLPPRTGITYQQMNIPMEAIPEQLPKPNIDAARVCILDSGINSNHPLLRSAIGEAESYIEGQGPEDEAGHGTAVAGILLYGDLEECVAAGQWSPESWIHSAKVMKQDPDSPGTAIFDVKTIQQTIAQAVDYFVGEQGCRIFNVSLGNENAPYDGRHVRGIAYILDLLAREHDILFVVSAGNFRGSENVPRSDWRNEYPDYLLAEESRIIDPAPALNVLTIGSLANHTADASEQRYGEREINALSPASEDQPSPFTRHGPSVKGAFKPDLVAHGGNLATPVRREGEQLRYSERRLGVLTLNHNFVGSTLLKDISGTSFAAPYIAHLASRLLNLYPNASSNLLRALLVNHADIPPSCYAAFPEDLHENIRQVTGYGQVDTDTLFRSTDYEVVLLTEDAIENDTHQFFELPLPTSFLRSNRSTRQLRITLAYCPPVRTTRMEYAATKICFRLVKGRTLEEVERHFNQLTKEDYDTIPDTSAQNRLITATERERCTVQSSIWEFRQLRPDSKYFVVVTRQDKDWGVPLCMELERYALVVTVSDRENEEAQLYTEIQTRIKEQVVLRERARIGL